MDRRSVGLWGSGHYKIYLGVLADSRVIGWNPSSTRYELFPSLESFCRITSLYDKRFSPTQFDSERDEFFVMVENYLG